MNELSKAPKLQNLSFKGNPIVGGESTRRLLADALNQDGSFPSLETLVYPATIGTYQQGEGASAEQVIVPYENPGEEELLKAARKHGCSATWQIGGLQYKVKGS